MYLHYFSDYSEAHESSNPFHYVAQAVDTLSSFRVIGALETMPAWGEAVEDELGMQISLPALNRSPCPKEQERIRSDRTFMKKISELCRPDMEIYEQALKSILTR